VGGKKEPPRRSLDQEKLNSRQGFTTQEQERSRRKKKGVTVHKIRGAGEEGNRLSFMSKGGVPSKSEGKKPEQGMLVKSRKKKKIAQLPRRPQALGGRGKKEHNNITWDP